MKEETKRKMFDSFVLLSLLAHRFEYITDRELKKDGLTSKQFLTIVAIEKGFDHSPSISELAEVLGTTHQNIKQIALQLKKKSFIRIEKAEDDKRKLILKTTAKNKNYWDSTAQKHETTIHSLFNSLEDEEIQALYALISKLLNNTDLIYRTARGL